MKIQWAPSLPTLLPTHPPTLPPFHPPTHPPTHTPSLPRLAHLSFILNSLLFPSVLPCLTSALVLQVSLAGSTDLHLLCSAGGDRGLQWLLLLWLQDEEDPEQAGYRWHHRWPSLESQLGAGGTGGQRLTHKFKEPSYSIVAKKKKKKKRIAQ